MLILEENFKRHLEAFASELFNVSRSGLQSPGLNQMIHNPHFEVIFWIKRFTQPLQSSNLSEIICDPHSEVSIWIERFKNPLQSSNLDLRF